MFKRLMFGRRREGRFQPSPLTVPEKLELLYISPYYLQAAFFLVGTLAWILAEVVFRTRLPFWTALWGWSLVLTNLLSLPLMNAIGLFLEEAEERDYLGILSFVILSYVLVPFQAYASVKGFIREEEGPWFRTPKTGKITDIFKRGTFYRWISGIIPGWKRSTVATSIADRPALAWLTNNIPQPTNPYLAMRTANGLRGFSIKPRRLRWAGKLILVVLLTISLNLYALAGRAEPVRADIGTGDGHDLAKDFTGTDSSSFNYILVNADSGQGQADASLIQVGDTSAVTAGDDVLVLGLTTGDWETCDVSSVVLNDYIDCAANLVNAYPSNLAQVVVMPQWTTVDIDSGDILTAATYVAGTGGGIIAFRATGAVTIDLGGSISVNGIGLSGGSGGTAGSAGASGGAGGSGGAAGSALGFCAGGAGGVGGNPGGAGDKTRSTGYGGGGAGGAAGGGGGGGNRTAGTAGTAGTSSTGGNGGNAGSNGGSGSAGSAGSAGSGICSSADLTVMFLGSGGGGAAGGNGGGGGKPAGGAGGAGGSGGNGAGIIAIWADSISVSGTMSAGGNNGTAGTSGVTAENGTSPYSAGGGGSPGGGGGGGAGGAIFIRAGTVTLGNNLTTALGGDGTSAGSSGGAGGAGNAGSAPAGSASTGAGGGGGDATTVAGGNASGGPAGGGGDGGDGAIHVEYVTLSGDNTTNPTADTTEIPEKLLFFIPLAIILPKLLVWWEERKKRGKPVLVYNCSLKPSLGQERFGRKQRGPPD